jgi:endonuclease/exonuclease/phosphatase family metal-dependent hydrolase
MLLGLVAAAIFAAEVAIADEPESPMIRIATLNASLYGETAGEIRDRLQDGRDEQGERIAAIVQSVRPDVLLVNEIDYDDGGTSARLLAERFFADGRGRRDGIDYPYVLALPSNTGVDSQLDLNDNGRRGEPNDAWGYGRYPGQYAMAVFSRYPIVRDGVRTFRTFLWKDLPSAQRPVDPDTGDPYHDEPTWVRLRLSSKTHADVPVRIGNTALHLLVSHPTPPVFDGPEDLNGRRNHDEIRFWSDYLAGSTATQLIDDRGQRGGLPVDAPFVILGDLNADPDRGDGRRGAIRGLLNHPRVRDPRPTSPGAADASDGDRPAATADFGQPGPLRVDYVLPSQTLEVERSGVFWPARSEPGRDLVTASDHRMVWVEVPLR